MNFERNRGLIYCGVRSHGGSPVGCRSEKGKASLLLVTGVLLLVTGVLLWVTELSKESVSTVGTGVLLLVTGVLLLVTGVKEASLFYCSLRERCYWL